MAEGKVRLVKSQAIRLTKVTSQLRKVTAGMGWRPSGSYRTWDLDQTLLCIDEYGRCVKEISYRSPIRSKEFHYHGDDLVGGSGKGRNDDEMIDINFPELNPRYSRLIVIMNIYSAYSKGQDLSMVKDAYIHLWDADARKDLVEYPIENTDKFIDKTGMFVGEFYKKDGEWEFCAIGEPVRVKDIAEMLRIAERKYQSNSTRNQSWEDFLSGGGSCKNSSYGSNSTYAETAQAQSTDSTATSSQNGFWDKLRRFFQW